MENVREHEDLELTAYTLRALTERYGDEITIHGPVRACRTWRRHQPRVRRMVHPHDIAQVLDQYNICVRAGNHCAKPLMQVLERGGDHPGLSLYLYNDESDVDAFVDALAEAGDIFGFLMAAR